MEVKKHIARWPLAAAAALAVAAAPAALAAPGGVPGKPEGTPGGKPAGAGKPEGAPSHGAGKPGGPRVAYVFTGVYEGESTVGVTGGNKRGRALDGESIQFDLSAAHVSVADTSGDGVADLADVLAGDLVVVKAKLPKTDPLVQPITARQLVDKTNPAPEEIEEG